MTGVFETKFLRNFPTEPIICVKEDLLRKSPNSLTRTFLNADIIFNSRVSSQKLGSTDTALCSPSLKS